MRKQLCLLMLLVISINVSAQTLKIVNRSGATIFFNGTAFDNSKQGNTYTFHGMIMASSVIEYKTSSEANWLGNAPTQGFHYSLFNAQFMDAAGACVSNASNSIGDKSQSATLNVTKCGGASGDLHIVWSKENNNVVVTIN